MNIPLFIELTPSQFQLSVDVLFQPIEPSTDVGNWINLYLYVKVDGGTQFCETNEFTVIVPVCSFGTIVQTPSGIVAVGQLTTSSITLSTSQTPSPACLGFAFTVN
jgi:hypothetical protein